MDDAEATSNLARLDSLSNKERSSSLGHFLEENLLRQRQEREIPKKVATATSASDRVSLLVMV